MYISFNAKCSLFLSDFIKFEFSQHSLKKKNTQISSVVKIRPVGSELLQTDRLTDAQTLMTKLIVAFRKFASAPGWPYGSLVTVITSLFEVSPQPLAAASLQVSLDLIVGEAYHTVWHGDRKVMPCWNPYWLDNLCTRPHKQTGTRRICLTKCTFTGKGAGKVQSIQWFPTGWTVRGSNFGGGPDFPYSSRPVLGPPSLLYNGYRVLTRGKAAGAWRGVGPYNAEVKERVELYS